MKLNVLTLDGGKSSGDVELSDDVFGLEPRADILHRVVTWQLEKRRAPAAATRERSDVARTGKKFGRQKGGGTARHGDRRAPIFIGGGKAHGQRARTFGHSLNKKVRALGLKMALSAKAKSGAITVLDNLDVKGGKTKELAGQLAKLSLKKALCIYGEAINVSCAKGVTNLVGGDVIPATLPQVYDIRRWARRVLTRAAVEQLEARFNG